MLWIFVCAGLMIFFAIFTAIDKSKELVYDGEIWGLWLAIAVCACIAVVIMSATAYSVKYDTRAFVINYNTHVSYLQSVQGKKITNAERFSEVEAINTINQAIADAKVNKADPWVGAWVKDIDKLEPLSFDAVPKAIENNDVELTTNLNGK
jgi:glucan phosphoethanolaminetransferase (alkaline phosphatase superfamily)